MDEEDMMGAARERDDDGRAATRTHARSGRRPRSPGGRPHDRDGGDEMRDDTTGKRGKLKARPDTGARRRISRCLRGVALRWQCGRLGGDRGRWPAGRPAGRQAGGRGGGDPNLSGVKRQRGGGFSLTPPGLGAVDDDDESGRRPPRHEGM
jgi:hypothetical protein